MLLKAVAKDGRISLVTKDGEKNYLGKEKLAEILGINANDLYFAHHSDKDGDCRLPDKVLVKEAEGFIISLNDLIQKAKEKGDKRIQEAIEFAEKFNA